MAPEKYQKKALVVITFWDCLGKNPQVLLLQRPPQMGGFWQPVTGGVEPGESFVEAALREAQEETGLSFPLFPQDLFLEHTFKGQWGWAQEKSFLLALVGDKPPQPTLDGKEHCEYKWWSPEQAQRQVNFPHVRESIFRASVPPLYLSKEGEWFQEGEKITHGRTVDLFHRSLEKNKDSFVVCVGGESLWVIVEDSPLHVVGLDKKNYKLELKGGVTAGLDPSTLFLGKDNAFYCRIGGLRARFHRTAYYQLCECIEEKVDSSGGLKYFLHWEGRGYWIPVSFQGQ